MSPFVAVDRLRVIVADDERPARAYLMALLSNEADVQIVGEASNGAQAVELIEARQPDIAFLDLQMPEMDGFEVVRGVSHRRRPLFIFVTAYDQQAARAFGVDAVDYLLKPVEPARLRDALRRAQDRLERADLAAPAESERFAPATASHLRKGSQRIDRIPVRSKNDIVLVPVSQITSVVAEAELLHLTTVRKERHTITYRLKDLEARLGGAQFVRLGRGTLVNVDMISRVTPMPGGTYTVTLLDGQVLDVSRIQSRRLRQRLLRL